MDANDLAAALLAADGLPTAAPSLGPRRSAAEWIALCQEVTDGYMLHEKNSIYPSALALKARLERYGLWKRPGVAVLDIGCGNGRLAMALADAGQPIQYVGLDVVPASIAFCQRAFADYPTFQFLHLDVRNGHYRGREGSAPPWEVELPIYDDSVDSVVCASLFTHLGLQATAERYLREIHRVLKRGGRFLSTWYTTPPQPEASNREAKTVYPQDWVRQVIDANGLTWLRDERDSPEAQWLVLATK